VVNGRWNNSYKTKMKILQMFSSAVIAAVFFAVAILPVHAASYGEGTYGSGEYNVGEETPTPIPTTDTSSSSSAGAPVCNDTKPSKAPWLYGASAKSKTSILLQFTEAGDPVSEYVLEYGTESGKYQFATSGIGGKGTTSYLVESLSPNTTYYFRVRGGNGCATGEWSNELSASTQSGFLFMPNITDLETEIVETEVIEKEEETECKSHVVEEGESLSQIAGNLLGDPNKYTQIVEINKDKYPSLAENPSSIEMGWELEISCGGEFEEASDQEELTPEVVGVDVRIKVIDSDKTAVAGAKVTLYSTPQERSTDNEGIARFEKVEPGEHRVVIDHNGQTGEQKINIQEDSELEEVDFTIQIKSTSPFKDTKVIATISGLALALIVTIGLLIKRRKV
jgi:hypothetical protein